MLINHSPRNRKERHTPTLTRKLSLGTHMEEGKVACDEVVRHAGSLVEHVDLAGEHVLSFFVGVGWDVAYGAGGDAVEPGG
jgi:hypothetical protein